MTKIEFENSGATISDSDFEVLNFVYTFHPAISEVKGKEQIAHLYATLGMRVILDMVNTATQAKEIEEKIRFHKNELEKLKEAFAELKRA